MRSFMRKLICVFITAVTAAALCTVSVSAASAKLNKKSVTLPVKYSAVLKVTGTGKDVTWTTGDSSVAYIKSSDGSSAKIVGKKAGSTYIYAKADGVNLRCKVTVKKSVITLGENDIKLNKGESKKITVTVKGSKDIVLKNDDKSVCSASLGKWDGNRITLTLTAKNSGTADIKIYPKGYSSSAKLLRVNVSGKGGSGAEESSAQSSLSADAVIELVNAERKANGLPPLSSDEKLMQAAELRAEEIAGYFSHTRPDGSDCFTALEDAGFSNRPMGENIAAGQRSASEVVSQWMSSSGHRANILSSDFSKIGVGVYKGGRYKYYWVQVFVG